MPTPMMPLFAVASCRNPTRVAVMLNGMRESARSELDEFFARSNSKQNLRSGSEQLFPKACANVCLQLKGAIDAMGCRRDGARHIVDTGADYVLALKGNQSTLLRRVRRALEVRPARCSWENSSRTANVAMSIRAETGRRFAMAWHHPASPDPDICPGLRTVAVVESTREIGDAVTTGQRYYLSSLPPDAKRIAQAVRSHWGFESMHRVLDVIFRQD